MNSPLAALAVAFVAGFAGGYFGQTLAPSADDAAEPRSATDAAALEDEVRQLRKAVHELRNPPEALTATGSAPAPAGDGPVSGRLDAHGGEDALLARIDARIDARVESEVARRLAEAREGESGKRRGRRGKKRLALADAAAELELTAREEDELRRIYEESQGKIFKMLAEPDGDPEEIKREILSSRGTPGAAQKVVQKYLPKFFAKAGDLMAMQAERQAAIVKAVGPEKAQRLQSEYSIQEDDLLGVGGQMSVDVETRVDGR